MYVAIQCKTSLKVKWALRIKYRSHWNQIYNNQKVTEEKNTYHYKIAVKYFEKEK